MDGLASCKIMVLVFSANANNSAQVRREVERAINRGLTILPVRIQNVEPGGSLEYALGNTHWLDAFTPPVERQLQRLLETVQMLLAQKDCQDEVLSPNRACVAQVVAVSADEGRQALGPEPAETCEAPPSPETIPSPAPLELRSSRGTRRRYRLIVLGAASAVLLGLVAMRLLRHEKTESINASQPPAAGFRHDHPLPTSTVPQDANDEVGALINRGDHYWEKGEHDKAIADYDEAIHLDPTKARAFNNRGVVYAEQMKEYDQAIADFDEAIRLNPRYAEAFNGRGLAYACKQQYDNAILDFTQAIELNPASYWFRCNRGVAYREQKAYDKAIADFTEAIRLDPKSPTALENRGFAYLQKEEYDLAIADYTDLILLSPKAVSAYLFRSKAYAREGNQRQADEDYAKAIELDPGLAKPVK